MWDGQDAVVPPSDEAAAPANPADQVYVVRVQATEDLELIWEVVQPAEETAVSFSAAMRRSIGVIRMMGNDRDLRLVYGSALDRLFDDAALRARVGQSVAEVDLHAALGDEGARILSELSAQLGRSALPTNLSLGLTSSQGLSIGALIGLLAQKGNISLPLSLWGSGTRRLAALEVASAHTADASLRVIDEIERGLEPYRLRSLIRSLCADGRQTFATTHSVVAIESALESQLWYVDTAGQIGKLDRSRIENQQARDPETFLSRFPVIAEGKTEIGFLSALLEEAFDGDPLDHGVRVCLGEGNENTLNLLEALTVAGISLAGFVDDEGRFSGRWTSLKQRLGDRLFRWNSGCTEQIVIAAIPDNRISELLQTPDGGKHGARSRTIAVRLGIDDSDIAPIQQALEARQMTLRDVIVSAATGSRDGAPEGQERQWKSHGRDWFKTAEGGRELFDVARRLGAWSTLRSELLPLVNAIRTSVGLSELDELNP